MLVLATALMIVLLLIFVAVLSMIQTRGIIVSIRGSVEAVLDSYTVDMGREIAGSIKSGHNYTAVLDKVNPFFCFLFGGVQIPQQL